ncbi:MAG: lipopolysaccharide kinase InaA family protein [Planctomycetota bacterium]
MRDPIVPPAFELEGDADRGWVAWRRDVAPALRGSGFGLDSDGAVKASGLEGRGAVVELESPELSRRGVRAVLRTHRRGGLPAKLGVARFGDPARPFDELLASERLRERGIPTPAVLAARARRASGERRRYDLAIVTERVEGASDLADALVAARGKERAALLGGVGAFVARLFDAGLVHVDLHAKNLLVREGDAGPEFVVLDLDRCRVGDSVAPAKRYAILARFLRWFERRRERVPFSRSDALRLLRGAVPAAEVGPAFRRLVRR